MLALFFSTKLQFLLTFSVRCGLIEYNMTSTCVYELVNPSVQNICIWFNQNTNAIRGILYVCVITFKKPFRQIVWFLLLRRRFLTPLGSQEQQLLSLRIHHSFRPRKVIYIGFATWAESSDKYFSMQNVEADDGHTLGNDIADTETYRAQKSTKSPAQKASSSRGSSSSKANRKCQARSETLIQDSGIPTSTNNGESDSSTPEYRRPKQALVAPVLSNAQIPSSTRFRISSPPQFLTSLSGVGPTFNDQRSSQFRNTPKFTQFNMAKNKQLPRPKLQTTLTFSGSRSVASLATKPLKAKSPATAERKAKSIATAKHNAKPLASANVNQSELRYSQAKDFFMPNWTFKTSSPKQKATLTRRSPNKKGIASRRPRALWADSIRINPTMHIQKIPEDGNCFFNAVCFVTHAASNDSNSVQPDVAQQGLRLRKEVCEHLLKQFELPPANRRPSALKEMVDSASIQFSYQVAGHHEESHGNLRSFFTDLKSPGVFIEHDYEILAASFILKRSIRIWHSGSQPPTSYIYTSGQPCINILRRGGHYEAIVSNCSSGPYCGHPQGVCPKAKNASKIYACINKVAL